MARKLHWVQKKIDSLDPETQYDEILKLVADYRIQPVFMNLMHVVALGGSVLPLDGSELVMATGNMVHRSEDRFNGTADAFFTWFANGSNSEVTKKSIERLNRYHLGMARRHPKIDQFNRNDDWLYSTCALGLFGVRLREALGLPPESERMNIAWHHFLRDLSRHLRGQHGPVVDFPEDFAAMRRLVEEFENRPWPQTDDGQLVMKSVVQGVCDRTFPRGLHWFGRTLSLLITPEPIRRAHRMGDPGRFAGPFVRAVTRTAITLIERFAPDPKEPFTEVVWKSEEYKQKVAKRNARMKRLHDERVRRGELPPPPKTATPKQEILGETASTRTVGSGTF